MNIEKTIENNKAILAPEGWLDAQSSEEFSEVIESLGDDITEMVIDLAKLEYISSAGMRLIVTAHKKMNGNLTICNVSDELMEIFVMTGFDRRLNFV